MMKKLTFFMAMLVVFFAVGCGDQTGGEEIEAEAEPMVLGDAFLPGPAYPTVLENRATPEMAVEMLNSELEGIEEVPVEAKVLKATLLSEAGFFEESEDLWQEIASQEKSLRTFALQKKASSIVERGASNLAAEVLESLVDEEGFASQLALANVVAAGYADEGKNDKAVALYEKVIENSKNQKGKYADEARLAIVNIYEDEGKFNQMGKLLRRTMIKYRRPDTFVQARKTLGKLSGRLGAGISRFSEKEYRDFARRMALDARFNDVLEVLNEWEKVHPSTRNRDEILYLKAKTNLDKWASNDSLANCQSFNRRFSNSKFVAPIRYVMLRLAVRKNQKDKIERYGEDILSGNLKGVDDKQKYEAGKILTSNLVSGGKLTKAIRIFKNLIPQFSNEGWKRELLWRAGIAAYLQNDYADAVDFFDDLEKYDAKNTMLYIGLYWKGRSCIELGNYEKAAESFCKILQLHRYHYYSMLAEKGLEEVARELDEETLQDIKDEYVPETLEFPDINLQPESKNDPRFKAASILARAGLLVEAADFITGLARDQKEDKALILCAARTYNSAGVYKKTPPLLQTHLKEYMKLPATGLPEDFWNIAYPRPFREEITAQGERYGVSPLLMTALMRHESRYDPEVISYAGAIGLFQIMPQTAKRLSPVEGFSDLSDDALKRPEVNSAVGAKLLSSILDKYEGHLPAVLASYNAGEFKVKQWLETMDHLPHTLFVDALPYSQTRTFTRAVLTSYYNYIRIYESDEEINLKMK